MNREKLLAKARNNPRGLRFTELCQLAEAYGFRFIRQTGSHRHFGREGVPRLVTLSPDQNRMAKSYQVRDVIDIIDQYGE